VFFHGFNFTNNFSVPKDNLNNSKNAIDKKTFAKTLKNLGSQRA